MRGVQKSIKKGSPGEPRFPSLEHCKGDAVSQEKRKTLDKKGWGGECSSFELVKYILGDTQGKIAR